MNVEYVEEVLIVCGVFTRLLLLLDPHKYQILDLVRPNPITNHLVS